MEQRHHFDTDAIKIAKLFATPVASAVHPQAQALNERLQRVIRERMTADQGKSHSNEGGWQSSADFSQWAGDAGQQLLDFGLALANQLTAVHSPADGLIEPSCQWKHEAWANVSMRPAAMPFRLCFGIDFAVETA